jgi:cell division topological specificity factor
MKQLLRRFLGQGTPSAASDAKQRLKVLLVHDEIDLPPAKMERMREEILEVVARYVDVRADEAVIELQKDTGGVAVISNLPVRRIHARA